MAGFALHGDRALMGNDEGMGETQTKSASRLRSTLFRTEEPVENMGDILFGDSCARIFDDHHGISSVRLYRYFD